MVDHFCATYGFLKHFDTKIAYIIIIIKTSYRVFIFESHFYYKDSLLFLLFRTH